VCRCAVEGTDAISVDGSGQPANPYIIDATISDDVGNSLEVRGDGLYVGTEIVEGVLTGTGIDGDGTGPDPLILYPPSASVSVSGIVVIPHNTSTGVSFTTVAHEIGGNLADLGAQPQRLTAPVNGVYRCDAEVDWTSFTADTQAAGHIEDRYLTMTKNGAGFTPGLYDYRNPATSYVTNTALFNSMSQRIGRTIVLNAGDYIALLVNQRNIGSLSRSISGAVMSMTYIGPQT
jgi:hypothetical protein